MSKIEDILGGDVGFTPKPVEPAEAQAAWARHTAQSEPEQEPDVDSGPAGLLEPEAAPAPVARAERPAPAASDVALLRADGWSDEDIKGLSPEAAARHALRVGGRPRATGDERADESSGVESLEADLTEELGAKTAKKVAPYIQKLTKEQAALSRDVREQRLDGLRERYQGQYPELARAEAQKALLAVVGENPSRDQYERGLRVLWGTRQTPDERHEARGQVDGQMGFGQRGPAQQVDPEMAKRAAWNHYQKTRDADAAAKLRGRLSTR